MDPHKDYYRILQVPETASKEEIKSSYRALVKKYHPDRNQSNTAECDELLKGFNEAYEVLSDEAAKFVYDEYRRVAKDTPPPPPEEKAGPKEEDHYYEAKNKRRYVKKKTVNTERRVYISGDLTAKFCGVAKDDITINSLLETHFRINANDVYIDIYEEDIFPLSTPPDKYKTVYSETELFKTLLAQPIKCRIKNRNSDDFYKLIIKDIRVVDPLISDVIKHEGEAFGTIKGKVYGYVQHFEKSDVYEDVTECFGETGNTEYKTEKEEDFYRKEYFYIDCTTYWGNWIRIERPGKRHTAAPVNRAEFEGCGHYWWLFLLIPLIIFAPQLLLWLIPVALILALLNFGSSTAGFLVPFFRIISGILFLLFIVFGLQSIFNPWAGKAFQSNSRTNKGIVRRTYKKTINGEGTRDQKDSLISNFIQWYAYDSIQYATTLSISEIDLRASKSFHQNLNVSFSRKEDFSQVYEFLKDEDSSKLKYVYSALDSLKDNYDLGEDAFAKAVVSCVQAFHYSLVFDNSCNNYDRSDFVVTSFLATCDQNCCVGYEKFGVRSPVEFLSDLNGDCDTRTLLLFTILRHYNYNVALLTSVPYKHSVIAVRMDDNENPTGVSMYINDQRYLLWETTSPGWKPGVIPPELADLANWDITLLSD